MRLGGGSKAGDMLFPCSEVGVATRWHCSSCPLLPVGWQLFRHLRPLSLATLTAGWGVVSPVTRGTGFYCKSPKSSNLELGSNERPTRVQLVRVSCSLSDNGKAQFECKGAFLPSHTGNSTLDSHDSFSLQFQASVLPPCMSHCPKTPCLPCSNPCWPDPIASGLLLVSWHQSHLSALAVVVDWLAWFQLQRIGRQTQS